LEAALNGLVVLSFLLGFRHGIDWDHIAAITDLIGGENERKKGFVLAFWYAIGHEVVIVVLGGCAVLFGMTLPEWVDDVMERIVGITLILLATFLLTSLYRNSQEYIMVSRYRLLFTGFYNLYAWVVGRFFGKYRGFDSNIQINVSRSGAFAIGIAHGIGAETPTQLMMFAAASGVGSSLHGVYTVLAFVVGLLLSHTILALISLCGFIRLLKSRTAFRSLAIFTSAYSFGMGILFVIGKSSILPAIL
jgi:high-affinity nickel permease